MDPRTVIIVNPKSHGGRLGKRWTELADTIGRVFPFDEAVTQAPGDATRLAREALKAGAERVVAIGGDGTINEVVNGLSADFGRVTLGIIPWGTGNDFARSIGVPADTPR